MKPSAGRPHRRSSPVNFTNTVIRARNGWRSFSWPPLQPRKSRAYRERRILYEKTKPVQVAIGERRRPDPQGRPGYLRIDTVHQGDLDAVKGVYHINAGDEV